MVRQSEHRRREPEVMRCPWSVWRGAVVVRYEAMVAVRRGAAVARKWAAVKWWAVAVVVAE